MNQLKQRSGSPGKKARGSSEGKTFVISGRDHIKQGETHIHRRSRKKIKHSLIEQPVQGTQIRAEQIRSNKSSKYRAGKEKER